MKKSLLFVFTLLFSFSAFSQKVEISILTGYQGWGKFYTSAGTVRIDDAQTYGGTVGIPLTSGAQLEFMYNRQDTRLEYDTYYNLPNETLPKVSLNYYLLSLAKTIELPNEKIVPFGSFGMGLLYAAPKDSKYTDQSRFAFAVNLGLKVYLTEFLGLRFQTGLYVPVQGVGVTIGTGGMGLTTMSTIIQGNISGGVVLAVPSKK
jgi:hypothetical protein